MRSLSVTNKGLFIFKFLQAVCKSFTLFSLIMCIIVIKITRFGYIKLNSSRGWSIEAIRLIVTSY